MKKNFFFFGSTVRASENISTKGYLFKKTSGSHLSPGIAHLTLTGFKKNGLIT